jgi:hypothetical protein
MASVVSAPPRAKSPRLAQDEFKGQYINGNWRAGRSGRTADDSNP